MLCAVFACTYCGIMQAVRALTEPAGAIGNPISLAVSRPDDERSFMKGALAILRGEADVATAAKHTQPYVGVLLGTSLLLLLAFFHWLECRLQRAGSPVPDEELYLDPLTGAWNRRAGERDLARAFSVWKTAGINSAVYFLDLDDFKRINDEWGHDVGDLVLQRIVGQLQGTMRHSDKIYRWGGEEFIVVCEGVDAEDTESLGEGLRRAVLLTSGSLPSLSITASIGVSVFQRTDTQFRQALTRADRAMYGAKHAGKNRLFGHPTFGGQRI